MTKTRNEMIARCELALMGKVVKVADHEVNEMTTYLLKVLNIPESSELWEIDFLAERIQRYCKNHVEYMVVNTIEDMACISYLLKADEDDESYPAPFEEDYGSGYPCAFCYVLNTQADELCSEFGDCFFEKEPSGFYHRVS